MSPEVIAAIIIATLVLIFVVYSMYKSAQQTAADRTAEIQQQQLATLQKLAAIPPPSSI